MYFIAIDGKEMTFYILTFNQQIIMHHLKDKGCDFIEIETFWYYSLLLHIIKKYYFRNIVIVCVVIFNYFFIQYTLNKYQLLFLNCCIDPWLSLWILQYRLLGLWYYHFYMTLY